MNKIEKLKELIDKNAIDIQMTEMECAKVTKKTEKYAIGTVAFFAASVAIFNGLDNVLHGSGLVLACTPTISCMIASGTHMVMNHKKANLTYSKLHDLDIERFDLNLELNLRKKGIIKEAIETNDFTMIDDELIEEASREELVSLSQALIEDNHLQDEDIHNHGAKKINL